MKTLKKWKKPPGNIIILQKYTKNDDHMLAVPEILDIVCDRCNFYIGLFFAV